MLSELIFFCINRRIHKVCSILSTHDFLWAERRCLDIWSCRTVRGECILEIVFLCLRNLQERDSFSFLANQRYQRGSWDLETDRGCLRIFAQVLKVLGAWAVKAWYFSPWSIFLRPPLIEWHTPCHEKLVFLSVWWWYRQYWVFYFFSWGFPTYFLLSITKTQRKNILLQSLKLFFLIFWWEDSYFVWFLSLVR